jgi:hypothetical protein
MRGEGERVRRIVEPVITGGQRGAAALCARVRVRVTLMSMINMGTARDRFWWIYLDFAFNRFYI